MCFLCVCHNELSQSRARLHGTHPISSSGKQFVPTAGRQGASISGRYLATIWAENSSESFSVGAYFQPVCRPLLGTWFPTQLQGQSKLQWDRILDWQEEPIVNERFLMRFIGRKFAVSATLKSDRNLATDIGSRVRIRERGNDIEGNVFEWLGQGQYGLVRVNRHKVSLADWSWAIRAVQCCKFVRPSERRKMSIIRQMKSKRYQIVKGIGREDACLRIWNEKKEILTSGFGPGTTNSASWM